MTMNKLQLAAVVITIAIIAPIGAGYLLAMEEVERTGWESTDSANLSDLILNSETAYYNVVNLPYNNAELQVASSGGLVAPDYGLVSATPSSLPIYTTVDSQVQQYRLTMDIGTPLAREPLFPVSWTYEVGAIAAFSWVSSMRIESDLASFNVNPQDVRIIRDGTQWFGYNPGTGYVPLCGIDGQIYLVSDRSEPVRIVYCGYSDSLPSNNYSFNSISDSSVRIVSDGTTYYDTADSFVRTGDLVQVGTTTYSNVTAVSVATPTTEGVAGSVSVISQVAGRFADPSVGWQTPGTSDVYWLNGQLNREVVVYLSLTSGDSVTMYPAGNENGAPVTISRAATMTSTTFGGVTTSLGNYSAVVVVVTSSGYTIGGIPAWPPMFTSPTMINTIDYEFTRVGDFAKIFLSASDVEFRVDSATIVAGTFPVTRDYSLDVSEYWPNSSWSVDFKNVGIYGEALQFAGMTYEIADGKIEISGEGRDRTVSLLDAIFTATYNGGEWTYSINNVEQSVSATDYPLVFVGEWSAGLEGFKIEQITETVTEWMPGEFVLDSTGFVLVSLAAVAACFVGLALYGRRSGGKVLWLLIICGAISVVILAMV